ncbi:MAG: hypothetical protein ACHQ0I_04760, partial [Candidatus Lutacidiplasmatales archaeon]
SYGTWVALGLTGLGWWRITWRWWCVLAYSVGGFAIWLAIGFPLVTTGTFSQIPDAYALNISLKASFFLVFFVPVMEGFYFFRKRDEAGPTRGANSPC